MLVGNGELPDTGELIGNGELLKKSKIEKRVEKVTLSAVHSQSQCSYVLIVRMRLGETNWEATYTAYEAPMIW